MILCEPSAPLTASQQVKGCFDAARRERKYEEKDRKSRSPEGSEIRRRGAEETNSGDNRLWLSEVADRLGDDDGAAGPLSRHDQGTRIRNKRPSLAAAAQRWRKFFSCRYASFPRCPSLTCCFFRLFLLSGDRGSAGEQ